MIYIYIYIYIYIIIHSVHYSAPGPLDVHEVADLEVAQVGPRLASYVVLSCMFVISIERG